MTKYSGAAVIARCVVKNVVTIRKQTREQESGVMLRLINGLPFAIWKLQGHSYA